ncbi:MAG: TetR/AcrR family transcriptional regulator [Bosea sp. (in: a-proteobacteria)]|uniref:TetR/AcrR family transcriptional regulator n=1 Tax=Bosea sp. (in: a-proteobacteria) TaxID=1871050 RepID=UPI0027347E42|nr:TetR/AcrR family transcriptional regulator [Bosea sp. (in: a-proteobacteria)]MDP3256817.1 TetR/AcrR family transcriptional regulator [Bosea sp. (in: a-proteobacteria)]MDP3321029.1 TetR/AcrR family transcriptional regulator [Bosea sp. (in: a-proteobacteria)]
MIDHDIRAGDGGPVRARGRPKQRPDSEERQRILAIACELFLDVGYGGTTMDAVAARCGISKKTLYRLFPAKIDLFKAMVADHRRTMLALPRPDDGLPPAEALAAIFRLEIDEAENRERLAFIRLALADAGRYPEIGEAIALEGAQAALQLLAEWLGEQQARGVLRPFPPQAAARMLMDMVFGVLVKRYPGDSLLSSEQRIGHARRCIEVFLTGLGERPKAA